MKTMLHKDLLTDRTLKVRHSRGSSLLQAASVLERRSHPRT